MNILDKIEQNKNFYTSCEKKIYNVISKNPELVQTYTITQIAGFSKVSTSAILRFCKRLGYNGYKDFKFDMELYLKSNVKEDPKSNPLLQISNSFSEAILSIPGNCEVSIYELAKHINNSDKVISLGRYRNKTVSDKLFTNLTNLGISCITASDPLTYENLERIITKETTVIIFSVMHDISNYQSVIKEFAELTDKFWLVTCNNNKIKNLGFHHYITLPSTGNTIMSIDQQAIMLVFIELLSYVLRHS